MANSPIQQQTFYSDFLFDFKRNPATHDILTVTNEQSVINSIKKILRTNNYEVPYNPRFGANIYHYLFEPFTEFTQDALEKEITYAIEAYEPRANLISVTVTGSPDENSIDITIVVSVINNPNPITVTTTLSRIR